MPKCYPQSLKIEPAWDRRPHFLDNCYWETPIDDICLAFWGILARRLYKNTKKGTVEHFMSFFVVQLNPPVLNFGATECT